MGIAVSHDLAVNAAALADVCRRFDVRYLAVFGSVSRGEARPDSDVDVLYELKPGRPMGYFELERLADALSPLFDGRYVDIARPSQIHPLIHDEVISQAKVLYEE